MEKSCGVARVSEGYFPNVDFMRTKKWLCLQSKGSIWISDLKLKLEKDSALADHYLILLCQTSS